MIYYSRNNNAHRFDVDIFVDKEINAYFKSFSFQSDTVMLFQLQTVTENLKYIKIYATNDKTAGEFLKKLINNKLQL